MTPPDELPDLRRTLEEALKGTDVNTPSGLGSALKEFRFAVHQTAESSFLGTRAGIPCSRFLCRACDLMVRQAAERMTDCSEGPAVPIAWVATGGYGRGLMSPSSAIRLTALHDGQDPAAARALCERVCAALTASGAECACAPSTVDEALDAMRRDTFVTISLLETRLVYGSKSLYLQLRNNIAGKFLPASWGNFMEEALNEALAQKDPFIGSPYCTEPNLKDGAGCLRDIGTAQKLNSCLRSLAIAGHLGEEADIKKSGLLAQGEIRTLRRALDFVLRLRNRLHFLNRERSDTLWRAHQPALARELGISDTADSQAAATLMRHLFRHTTQVTRILRALRERFLHVHRVRWRCAPLERRRTVGGSFAEVDGALYSCTKPPFSKADARRLMDLFGVSQRLHLPISQETLDQVAKSLRIVDDRFRAHRAVGASFLDLLAGGVGVAERIAWMRDCGLLQAYLPEFAPLVHSVDYQQPGDHTLDEHAIQALRVLDELAQAREHGELAQRHVLEQVDRLDILRLAILLRDLDRAIGPTWLDAVARLTERIGLPRAEREDVQFLLQNKDSLWEHAEGRRYEDAATIRALANQIGTSDRLNMLYLLTYAHAQAAGPIGWFSWRDVALYETYQKTMAVLMPHYTPFATADYFEKEFLESAQKAGIADRAQRFLSLLPALYKHEVSPAEALEHLRLVESLSKGAPVAVSWAIRAQQATVWICTSDVPARFAQIVAVFTYNGLNILSATAFTLSDGTVLDRFLADVKGGPINPDPDYWAKIHSNLADSIAGRLDVRRILHEKAKLERPPLYSRRLMTTVHIDNSSSNQFTILDIVTPDRPGLLFDMSDAISALGLNIELARIRTMGELAQDVFHVTDSKTSKPVADPTRLRQIQARILEAAEGAGGGHAPQ